MATRLTDEPLSTNDPVFHESATRAIRDDGFVVTTVRHSHAAGAKSFYCYNDPSVFLDDLAARTHKTCITVHAPASFAYVGRADSQALARARKLLANQRAIDKDASVDLILIDQPGELDRNALSYADCDRHLQEWLSKHADRHIAIGELVFWEDNTPKVFSAYVPDADGQVRPGAY